MGDETTNRTGLFLKHIDNIVTFVAALIVVFGGISLTISKINEVDSNIDNLTTIVEDKRIDDDTIKTLQKNFDDLRKTVENLQKSQNNQNPEDTSSDNSAEDGAQSDNVQHFSTAGSVRCPGGGDFLGRERNRRSETVILSAPESREIIPGSITIKTTGDHYGWHDPIKVEESPTEMPHIISARVRIFCNPPNYPGAPGGWMRITLNGQHREIQS